jgi:hypothetical protein
MDIKSHLTKLVSEHLGLPTDSKSLEKFQILIWQNPRKKDIGGLRLTEQGLDIFVTKMEMKYYEIEFPKEMKLTNNTTILLDRYIDSPYYITKKATVVFKEKTAIQLVLFSGDLEKFSRAKYQAEQNSKEIKPETA